MSEDEPLRFKTVVKYLEVKRTRYWETKEEASRALSAFQLQAENLSIAYVAELWYRKELLFSSERFSDAEKAVVAITGQRTA